MSWTNKAIEALEKAGYSIDVRIEYKLTKEYDFSPDEPPEITKTLKKGERIPQNAGELFDYDNIVTLEVSIPDIPENYESGGFFVIDRSGYIMGGKATGEALKVILNAGYKLPEQGTGGGGGSAGNVSDEKLVATAKQK